MVLDSRDIVSNQIRRRRFCKRCHRRYTTHEREDDYVPPEPPPLDRLRHHLNRARALLEELEAVHVDVAPRTDPDAASDRQSPD